MKEITDERLAELRASLSVCSPLVQSLVMRLDATEKQLEIWRNDESARCLDVSKLANENTALRERVKRMEEALPFTWEELNLFRQWYNSMQDTNRAYVIQADRDLYAKLLTAQAALKEGQ